MTGDIATVGSLHVCPMCSGSVPHVGGPILTSGAPGATLNGKSIALMGDICTCIGPPDVIAQGVPGVTINGVPIAITNCLTAHGGLITSGEVGATITTNSPTPIATLPLSDIPFPEIKMKDRLGAKLTGNSKALKEAEANQQQIKDASKAQEEEKREVTVTSTYPLDELNEYATQFGASFFSYALQAIFGDSVKGEDIPLHAYDYLYRDLSDKKVEMPEIKIRQSTFPKAKYKHSDNTIYIAQNIIIKATEEEDIKAMGELYQAIMEEFGHFIDWQLRNQYTTIGGDAKLDEGAVFGYCLTTFNVFKDTKIDFGKAIIDGKSYDLSIDLTEIQQQIDELVTQERIKRDEQKDDEEYFSAGKQTFKQAGGFTHYGIEEVLRANDILKNDEDLNYVYLGNLLRDWSQLITPTTERYTDTEKQEIINALGLSKEEAKSFFGIYRNSLRLSRKSLSFVVELIAAHEFFGSDLKGEQIGSGKGDEWVDFNPKEAAEDVVGCKTKAVKDWIVEKGKKLGVTAIEFSLEYYLFTKYFPKVTTEMVGVYRPEEHIDNPIGGVVVDLEKKEYFYWPADVDTDINDHFGMKSYIRNYDIHNKCEQYHTMQNGIKSNQTTQPTSSAYLTSQLELSFTKHKQGNKKESLLYFGNAMHLIEDYFAHSNFVELSLIKLGYNDVVPWVNRYDPKAKQFNKAPRSTEVFNERLQDENYFDDKSKIADFNSAESLYAAYPEAKTPIFSDDVSFTFDKGGAMYQFIHKRSMLELKGELHILRGVTINKDSSRDGSYLEHLPIVTGKFGTLDMIYSLSDKLESLFENDSFSWTDVISSEWEGKPIVRIIDLIVLTILSDLKHAQSSESHKNTNYLGLDYAALIEYYEYIITFRDIVFGVLEKAKKGKGWLAVGAFVAIGIINALEKVMMNTVKTAMRFIINSIAMGIRESQNSKTLDTNPTHTQIAKDDMEHPLHLLAGNLARIAVADIGMHYEKFRIGVISSTEVINLAKEYLSHPADVHWMDVTVMKWASTHIGSIDKAESKGFLDAFQKKHHDHVEHSKEKSAELLERVAENLKELKELSAKAKDMEKDLEVSKKIEQSINHLIEKLKF